MFACAANVAARARVSIEQAEVALAEFEAPDRNSGDPDNEGRRIERIPGGWHLLNAHKYRAMVTKAIIREQTRLRTAKYRKRDVPVTQCDAKQGPCDAPVTTSEALALAPALKNKTVGGSALRADPTTPPSEPAIPSQPKRLPAPPQPFDGQNAEALNGKAVVCIARDWELPDEWGLDAELLGFKRGEVLRESEKFRQYWVVGRGAGTRRSVKGWRQSWSTWLEKASRDQR